MRIFYLLLRLYPPEHQAVFAPEMLALLKERAHEGRQRRGSARMYFFLKESFDLLRGAMTEWLAKSARPDYLRNQQ